MAADDYIEAVSTRERMETRIERETCTCSSRVRLGFRMTAASDFMHALKGHSVRNLWSAGGSSSTWSLLSSVQNTRLTEQLGDQQGPRRRWKDDINEFLKLEENETENSTESDNRSTNHRPNQQKTVEDELNSKTITQ